MVRRGREREKKVSALRGVGLGSAKRRGKFFASFFQKRRPSFLRLRAAASIVPDRSCAHIQVMGNVLTLTLNGDVRSFEATLTVAGLLASIGLDSRKVAVERNEEIVPRAAYGETWLEPGDALEIVHFIGGG